MQASGDLILSDTHPIIKAFNSSYEIVRGETSEFQQAFEDISSQLKHQSARTDELVQYMNQLRSIFSAPGVQSVRSFVSKPTLPPEESVRSVANEESRRSRNLLDRLKK